MIAADYPPFSYVWVPAVVTTIGSFIGVVVGSRFALKAAREQRQDERELAREAFDTQQQSQLADFRRERRVKHLERRRVDLVRLQELVMHLYKTWFSSESTEQDFDFVTVDMLGVTAQLLHVPEADQARQLSQLDRKESDAFTDAIAECQISLGKAIVSIDEELQTLGADNLAEPV